MASITIRPSTNRRERILAFGGPGAGKSFMWQSILLATPPEVQFHVIDTDGAWEPAEAEKEFKPHVDRVHLTEPDDWTDYFAAIQKALANMDRERGDWFVLDMADEAWSAAQDYYLDRKYAGDMSSMDFFDDMIDGNIDAEDDPNKWPVINRVYSPMRKILVKCPGNVFVCATAKKMRTDSKGNYSSWESKQNVRDYGKLGVKPGGQKSAGHDVNTVLFLSKTGSGKRRFQVMKDRNREHLWDGKFVRDHNDVTRDMLMGVLGWEPVVGGGE